MLAGRTSLEQEANLFAPLFAWNRPPNCLFKSLNELGCFLGEALFLSDVVFTANLVEPVSLPITKLAFFVSMPSYPRSFSFSANLISRSNRLERTLSVFLMIASLRR